MESGVHFTHNVYIHRLHVSKGTINNEKCFRICVIDDILGVSYLQKVITKAGKRSCNTCNNNQLDMQYPTYYMGCLPHKKIIRQHIDLSLRI